MEHCLPLPVSYVMLMAVADGTDELLHGKGDISNSIPADLQVGISKIALTLKK